MHLTLASLLTGSLAASFIALGYVWIPTLLLLLSGYLDMLDGSLARFQGTSSPSGAVLDIISDRVVEFAVVLGLYLVQGSERGLLSLCMLGSIFLCVTSFLVVGIFSQNTSTKSFHYSSGLIERAEAFIFFIALIVFPTFFAPLAIAFTALVLYTTAHRLMQWHTFQQEIGYL